MTFIFDTYVVCSLLILINWLLRHLTRNLAIIIESKHLPHAGLKFRALVWKGYSKWTSLTFPSLKSSCSCVTSTHIIRKVDAKKYIKKKTKETKLIYNSFLIIFTIFSFSVIIFFEHWFKILKIFLWTKSLDLQ